MEFFKKHNITILCLTLIICLSSLATYNYFHQKEILLQQLNVDTDNIVKSVSSSISKFTAIKDLMNIQDLIKNISMKLDIFEFRYMDKNGTILNSMFKEEIGQKFERPNFDITDKKSLGKFYEDERDMTKVLAVSYPVNRGEEIVGIIDLAVDISEFNSASREVRETALRRMETDVTNLVNSVASSVLTSLSIFETVDFLDFLANFVKSTENIVEVALLDKDGKVLVSSNPDRAGKDLGKKLAEPQKGFLTEKGRDAYRIIDHVNPANPDGIHLMLLMDATSYVSNVRQLLVTAIATSLFTILFALTIAYSIYLINLDRVKQENVRLEQKVEKRTEELKEMNEHLKEEVGERKKVEAALLVAKKGAESASQAKSTFLANMSHEIRTPMNAILGYAQIMKRNPELGRELWKDLDAIERSGNHLLALINDILDISKIEAGRMELKNSDFDLTECLRDISSMFKVRCDAKGLEWRDEGIEEGGLLFVHGDEGKLRQVLINLLGNAVKFTDSGCTLLRFTPKGEERYLFESIDTGAGIPFTSRKSIFDPFQQDEQGHQKGGTGLGLAISSKQVELMGGKLEVESEPGEGSRFFFTLRLEPAKGEIMPRMEARKVVRLAKGSRVTALVVDDNQLNRDVLSKMLSCIGVGVLEAESGLAALDLARKNAPDIVFMDYRMPGMNGDEAIRHIKLEFGKKIKTVIVSASVYDHEREIFQKAGCDHMLPKPFRADEIFNCLADLLKVEFEYEGKETRAAMEASGTGRPDFSLIKLPADMAARLKEAAELYEITKIEKALEEIKDLGPEEAKFASCLGELVGSYNMEGVLEELNRI
ncbi:MAG: response regulator [Nitrospinae bacterium]|nr:response regulator [Nitrospinota bacterium]